MATIINIQICVDEMIKVWQSFRTTWDNTRNSWKDTERYQFEHEHIQEFNDATNNYIANLRRLADTIQQTFKEMP